MSDRDLPPLEWIPPASDDRVVLLIRARTRSGQAKKKSNPVAELEEQLRHELLQEQAA